ncbi:unnamed protein product [Polarella glacialis]|uniref:Uncharacterized protein n=1 Tax=Polarella glacialis TaxID=89957 RepID=A0A813ES97_POLGL|nr:unnamed protein product [Polarella glacialis]
MSFNQLQQQPKWELQQPLQQHPMQKQARIAQPQHITPSQQHTFHGQQQHNQPQLQTHLASQPTPPPVTEPKPLAPQVAPEDVQKLIAKPILHGTPGLHSVRLPKPHQLFPFDLFTSRAAEGLVDVELQRELGYVRDHCMVPPFPWRQVIYHEFLVANVLEDGDVPGDFAEFGIGQGGTSVFLARLAKKYRRKGLAVDSFEGLPAPDAGKDNPYFLEGDYRPKSGQDNLTAFLEYKSAFDVDDSLHVVKGFFRDIEIPPEFDSFAYVHMDSDLYDSVYDSLQKVWDRVSPGGAIAVDDFSITHRVLQGLCPTSFATGQQRKSHP